MALEATTITSKTTTPMEEVFLRKLLPEEISPAATAGNPVDATIAFQEDMARFQRAGISKEALREAVRKELNASACMEALQKRSDADAVDAGADRRPNGDRPGYLNIELILEYLREREAIRPKLSRAEIRRLAKSVLKQSSEKTSKKESSLISSKKESGS
jgi:hypothetical protein